MPYCSRSSGEAFLRTLKAACSENCDRSKASSWCWDHAQPAFRASQECWRVRGQGASLNPRQRGSWWETLAFLPLTVPQGTLWNGALVALIDNWSDDGSFIGFLPLPNPLSMFPGLTSYVSLT